MNDAPVVLGVNRTQDASICLMHGSEVVCAIQKERLTRRKHHWGRLEDMRSVYCPNIQTLKRPIDALVECYSSDAELAHLADYEQELLETLEFAPGCRRVRISHHVSHLYSVFPPSPFNDAAVMVVDGQGSEVSNFSDRWSGAEHVPGDWREVSSFYRADRNHIECLNKQLWNRNEDRLVGLGMFYFLLTHAIFPGEGNEGKVMGLAPHGDPQAFGLPPLEVEGPTVTIPQAWIDTLRDRKFRYATIDGDRDRFREIANLAAAGQRAFEDAMIEVANWLYDQTHAENLCFAGGTALNVSTNDRLWRETPFRNIFIPPAPSDAGTSLGCAMYGLREVLREPCDFRWETDFLGPEPHDNGPALIGSDDLIVETPEDLVAGVVDLLCDTKVIAVYQSRSEFGPRALGHRSILADPRAGATRDWINANVKQREWFRPLAPIVLLERAAEFFDMPRPSPFMQFAAPVLADAVPRIPAVTHVDGTARLQTVSERDDPFMRRLLEAFARRTGIPVLINTSFNRREEPIVETAAQAVESFRATPIHALVMPPYLVSKRVQPPPVT